MVTWVKTGIKQQAYSFFTLYPTLLETFQSRAGGKAAVRRRVGKWHKKKVENSLKHISAHCFFPVWHGGYVHRSWNMFAAKHVTRVVSS